MGLMQKGADVPSRPGTDEFDRLEVLAVLVQDYERTYYPIAPPDMQSAIEYELDKRGLTRQDEDTRRNTPSHGEIVSLEQVDSITKRDTREGGEAVSRSGKRPAEKPTFHG